MKVAHDVAHDDSGALSSLRNGQLANSTIRWRLACRALDWRPNQPPRVHYH